GLDSIPRSIASLVRRGRASTARRRRLAGLCGLARKRIAGWIQRGAPAAARRGGARKRCCSARPSRRVRRRRPCIPGDRAGAGAAPARARGRGRELGALAGGNRARGARLHRRRGVPGLPPAPARRRRLPVGGQRRAGARADAGGASPRRRGQRHPHPGARAGRRGGRDPEGDADPARLPGARARAAVLRARRDAAAHAARPPRLARLAAGADRRLRRGRKELNRTRAELGLPPLERYHGGLSEALVLVATFPQLEYPRRWPPAVHVTGPMEFELPYPPVEPPPGDAPLVLVAPSTAQDPGGRLVRVALEALAGEPVRVLATTNRPGAELGLPAAPPNAKVVEWISYSDAMRRAALVVCHGGHGTVARALALGRPVLCCPAAGDMAETGARVAWAGAGLSLPWRLTRPAPLRWAVRRMLADERFARRASTLARWAAANDGAARGAELVEGLAGTA